MFIRCLLVVGAMAVWAGQSEASVVFRADNGTMAWQWNYTTIETWYSHDYTGFNTFDKYLQSLAGTTITRGYTYYGSATIQGSIAFTLYADPVTGMPLKAASGGVARTFLPAGGTLFLNYNGWGGVLGVETIQSSGTPNLQLGASASLAGTSISVGGKLTSESLSITQVTLGSGSLSSIPFALYAEVLPPATYYGSATAKLSFNNNSPAIVLSAPLPEPATLSLLTVGGLFLIRRRKA